MSKYTDTLDFMFRQLPMYQREGKSAFKKDLGNILAFCKEIGNPEDKIKSIHVAGTNGKGTVTHILAHILQSQGYKVGVYTSPHYKDFRERIKINGDHISKREVISFIEQNKAIISDIRPSFFEMTVAMAFDYFANQQVDYAIIEVGLGGRLDSTNVITPLLSVITNISYDHVDMLGDTLELIAGEKAGIIKSNVPVIIGETQLETTPVFTAKAESTNSHIEWADANININEKENGLDLLLNDNQWLTIKNNPLLGSFQLKNIATAFYAAMNLEPQCNIDFSKAVASFGQLRELTGYMGRWQYISRSPDVLVDSAHNEGGIAFLKTYIEVQSQYESLHIVCGFVNDKDLGKILKLFPKNAKYYFAKANIPRGLDASILMNAAGDLGLIGKSYRSVRQALAAAKMSAKPNDLIFVGGSIFVVAEVL